MNKRLIFCASGTPSAQYARKFLQSQGIAIADSPTCNVTHLLLDVPSFAADSSLRSGGAVEALLNRLPPEITICGGSLEHPSLSAYSRLDLLQDPNYLADNAYITAECALDMTLPHFSSLLRGCPVLILGWGRIGKCLAQLLRNLGANVTVAARKEADRAALVSLGYSAINYSEPEQLLPRFLLIYNTVPAPLLSSAQTACCDPDCLLLDLASKPGIEGSQVISARGLPGLCRPAASGKLIAQTLLRIFEKEDKL